MFRLRTTHDGTISTVGVVGELDALSAPELRACLIAFAREGKHRVLLDLHELDFIDSAGIAVLLGGLKRLRALGGELVLKDPPPRVATILEVSGLDRVFSVV